MLRRLVSIIALSVTAFSLNAGAQSPAIKRDSQRMQNSLNAIIIRASMPPPKGRPPAALRTSFSDAELNAWLQLDGKENLPVGVVSPVVTFTGPNQVTAKAIVDLDAVRKSKERGLTDPLNWVSGLVPLELNGTLSGAGGQGTFDVTYAKLGSVPVPRSVLQELIGYYSKSPEYPNGISLGKPFTLPSAVRDLVIQRGSATVIQ